MKSCINRHHWDLQALLTFPLTFSENILFLAFTYCIYDSSVKQTRSCLATSIITVQEQLEIEMEYTVGIGYSGGSVLTAQRVVNFKTFDKLTAYSQEN
jgi:hypothetical protein